MCCASFKHFWPPALMHQAPVAIILAVLRHFRGPALFRGPRPSSSPGAPFWPSGLTLRSSGLAYGKPLTLAVSLKKFMSQENIAIAVVIALAVFAIIGKLMSKRMPKEKTFKCSRCKTVAMHNDRTVEAWRGGKTRFFCHSCHQKWLQSQPPKARESTSSYGSSGKGAGCLGIVLVLVFLPVGATLLAIYV